jgi:hypothetical protein
VTPDELRAIDERLEGFNGQLLEANSQLEYGSLERAADLAARFDDKSWVDDLPPLEKPAIRGRPIDPASRARFNQWLRDRRGWRVLGSQSNRLLRAHGFASIYGERLAINRLSGEKALNPLYRLERKGFKDQIPEVMGRAAAAAGEGPITSEHTRQAVRDFIAEQPKEVRAQAAGRRKVEEAEARWERVMQELTGLAIDHQYDYLARTRAWIDRELKRAEPKAS